MDLYEQYERYKRNSEIALHMLNYGLALCLGYIEANFPEEPDKLHLALVMHEHLLKLTEAA